MSKRLGNLTPQQLHAKIRGITARLTTVQNLDPEERRKAEEWRKKAQEELRGRYSPKVVT